ncbi:hypothetical protein [Acaryochloris sp. 'Moss Beach']|uniref:hypothetical protein n=1 Tax=Acaryochloris sp. 'Moss Beach' TaxID=2740837 RepID=UPI001F1B6A9C|nr:hypothetical protein [Acaryochloris sp. 'Moss Beach']
MNKLHGVIRKNVSRIAVITLLTLVSACGDKPTSPTPSPTPNASKPQAPQPEQTFLWQVKSPPRIRFTS